MACVVLFYRWCSWNQAFHAGVLSYRMPSAYMRNRSFTIIYSMWFEGCPRKAYSGEDLVERLHDLFQLDEMATKVVMPSEPRS